MNLKISLDDNWVNDYEETIATIIKQEIDNAIRAEVRTTVKKAVKEHLAGVQKTLEAQIKKSTPGKLMKLLEALGD